MIGLGDIEGDIGGERRLAHAGTARDDDEIGLLQAAHFLVEILEPGRHAREMSVALIGAVGHVYRDGQRIGEALEAAVVAAGLGDGVELALGFLDLLARRGVDRRIEGRVDDLLADVDQIAAHREIVDRAAVILGVDDRRGLGGETRQIALNRDAFGQFHAAQKGLERNDGGQLSRADQLSANLIDAPVQLLGKMLRAQEVRHAVERVVVEQQRAKQRLLRFDIMRRDARRGLSRLGDLIQSSARQGIDCGHWLSGFELTVR